MSINITEGNSLREYNITVYSENSVGLSGRITGIFTRRKINIESLNTSPSEISGIYRFTILICQSYCVTQKLLRQIEKLTEVIKVYCHTDEQVVWQELALYKIPAQATKAARVDLEKILRIYGTRAIALEDNYTILETTGQRQESKKMLEVLSPYGLIEFVRTARIAIIKESSGFIEKLREFEAGS